MSDAASRVEADTSSFDETIAECRYQCLERTLIAFEDAEIATADELYAIHSHYLKLTEEDPPADLIELLVRLRGIDEEFISEESSRIANAVNAVTSSQIPPLIPFAGKLMTPNGFYDSHDHLKEIAKALLTPVIFAEDTDAIGTGGLNPIAASIMGEQIMHYVNENFSIKPFITVVRVDYESWCFLNRKHFGL